MALIQKIDPVGVDIPISEFQEYLYNALGYTDWQCYPRVYLNPRNNARIPEHFTGSGEYIEVMYDDNFSISTFFLVGEDRTVLADNVVEVDVALICQLNLVDLYPAIPHRADEEFHNDVFSYSDQYVGSQLFFTLDSIETGIDNVYREFDKKEMKLEDMSDQHVARFNYTVRYSPQC